MLLVAVATNTDVDESSPADDGWSQAVGERGVTKIGGAEVAPSSSSSGPIPIEWCVSLSADVPRRADENAATAAAAPPSDEDDIELIERLEPQTDERVCTLCVLVDFGGCGG